MNKDFEHHQHKVVYSTTPRTEGSSCQINKLLILTLHSSTRHTTRPVNSMTVSGSANLLSLLGLGGSTGNNNAQHMVGTAATLGLSLTLLRFMISKMDQDEGDSDEESMLRSYPMYQFLQTLVRRVLFLHHNKRRLQIGNGASGRDDESEDDNVPIIHQGACHCRSVQFEVRLSSCFCAARDVLSRGIVSSRV